ncbi:hypothetical protein WICANDRAFT_29727 [Wickerhamomyces anomalus NRRL Y-366-8]|uniref:Uncharacterized protein n=1 Tax=Wickerhamomyces anomalus (strain ATCC 58044 / CBS 1984 / NCYC 433 / NRRL Y-366-8) TaxID=683960 RepID=A0A1E3P3D4_WICAA|nr:uncharacterized protein WICANDRAFT_29727 [Wickerhamomyces anomalus NRRL Y-366-8]ODQ59989.1 hypothetical protein WICANDRAFT_29727 [Wickerhamomyces anomalus NRRL Y-366-8]
MVNITEWDPDQVTLTDDSVDDAWKTCVLQGVYYGDNEYNGSLGARISSIFVILFVSTAFTIFPLLARTFKRLKMPLYVYLFARYFGAGVIVATAFIHLLDPAYSEIGGQSCVGSTGNWAIYSWCPAIILLSIVVIFLVDVASDAYVERKYGIGNNSGHGGNNEIMKAVVRGGGGNENGHVHDHNEDGENAPSPQDLENKKDLKSDVGSLSDTSTLGSEKEFRSQISAFLVLEFGIIFHSVMIGLNLGSVGDEFKTLYIVLVFHQSFEGLGIGARLSAIPWPSHISYVWAYLLCIAYGLVTPIAVAIGLGVRTTYISSSYNANIVSGVLDAISAGILIYTGLVELLARDFIFEKTYKKDLKQLLFMIFSLLWGAGLMALLGKWA